MHVVIAFRRGCTARAREFLSVEEYKQVASITIDHLQEVYENFADDFPELQMDVECTVRARSFSPDPWPPMRHGYSLALLSTVSPLQRVMSSTLPSAHKELS